MNGNNSVFKVELSIVYNNNDITEDMISDNLFEAIKSIGNGVVIVNIDNIKKLTRTKQSITKMIAEISEEKNIKNDTLKDGTNYIEVDKKFNKKEKNNENQNELCE